MKFIMKKFWKRLLLSNPQNGFFWRHYNISLSLSLFGEFLFYETTVRKKKTNYSMGQYLCSKIRRILKSLRLSKWIIQGTMVSLKVKVVQSCLTLCDPIDYTVHGILPGQNTVVGSFSLLQGIFPTQRLNLGLPHCRWILYQLSHQGSPQWPMIPNKIKNSD